MCFGTETKAFHVRDGQGVRYWLRAGHEAAILSGRESPALRRRAEELGVAAVYEGAKDKLPVFEKILDKLHDPTSKTFMRLAKRQLRGEPTEFGRSSRFLFWEDRGDPAREG